MDTEAMIENLVSGIYREVRAKKFQEKYPTALLYMGTDRDAGDELYLGIGNGDAGLCASHTHILGATGSGKTRFLEGLVRHLIDQRYGVIVLDGKAGDTCLYERLRDYCVLRALENPSRKLDERTVLVDPNENDRSVGINYLEPMPDQPASALAGLALEGIKKLFREEKEVKVWLEEWTPACLIPLIKAGFTLLELFQFVNPYDPAFREAVLEAIDDFYFRDKWRSLFALRPYERALRLGPVMTRADAFWQDEILRAMFGQQKTTIDWLKVMDEGGIVLAKLGRTTKLSEKTARVIGTAILHQVTTLASQRPAHRRRPFFFLVDEFQKFVTSDFAEGLDTLREYGIHFVLAHQHLTQLVREAPEVLASVHTNCLNKIVFRCSREDAEIVTPILYSGLIHTGAEELKDEITHRGFEPVSVYKPTYEVSYSENRGRTDGKTITDGHDTTVSQSYGLQSGTGEGSSESDMYTTPLDNPLALVRGDGVHSEGAGKFQMEHQNTVLTDGQSKTTRHSVAQQESETKGRGANVSIGMVPVTEYREYEEVSNRTFYTVEEVKERYIAAVEQQPRRHAHWKFHEQKPQRVITPWIDSRYVTENARRRFTYKVSQRSARLRAEVLREIRGRVPRFLKRAASKDVAPVDDTSEDMFE